MATLHEVRAQVLATLRDIGIETSEAQREVDMILQHATGWSKSRQMAYPEAQLSVGALDSVTLITAARKQRMPLQYVLGQQWFMGLPFTVKSGVLIPRADTETLVAVALKFLRDLPAPVFADIGTGSGAIAVALLKILPHARAYAIDISKVALSVAAENAQAHGVSGRLVLVETSWSCFDLPVPVDAVLSNPPYVPASQMPLLAPEVAIFEPREALLGEGADGLGFFAQLSEKAPRHLRRSGLLAVEVGMGQAKEVVRRLTSEGWQEIGVHRDLNQQDRCVSALCAR